MADQEKDKQMQIDEVLDSLLANYSSAEPRPGLETRILANLILANPHDAEGRAPHGGADCATCRSATCCATAGGSKQRTAPGWRSAGDSSSAQNFGARAAAECDIGIESTSGGFSHAHAIVGTGAAAIELLQSHSTRRGDRAEPS